MGEIFGGEDGWNGMNGMDAIGGIGGQERIVAVLGDCESLSPSSTETTWTLQSASEEQTKANILLQDRLETIQAPFLLRSNKIHCMSDIKERLVSPLKYTNAPVLPTHRYRTVLLIYAFRRETKWYEMRTRVAVTERVRLEFTSSRSPFRRDRHRLLP